MPDAAEPCRSRGCRAAGADSGDKLSKLWGAHGSLVTTAANTVCPRKLLKSRSQTSPHTQKAVTARCGREAFPVTVTMSRYARAAHHCTPRFNLARSVGSISVKPEDRQTDSACSNARLPVRVAAEFSVAVPRPCLPFREPPRVTRTLASAPLCLGTQGEVEGKAASDTGASPRRSAATWELVRHELSWLPRESHFCVCRPTAPMFTFVPVSLDFLEKLKPLSPNRFKAAPFSQASSPCAAHDAGPSTRSHSRQQPRCLTKAASPSCAQSGNWIVTPGK